MNSGIGRGELIEKESGLTYRGTLPSEARAGDKLVIISESDLEIMLEHELGLHLAQSREMSNVFYNLDAQVPESCEDCLHIPDELVYLAVDGTQHRLFLERKFYSPNPKDYLLSRWVSVDEAVAEGDLE